MDNVVEGGGGEAALLAGGSRRGAEFDRREEPGDRELIEHDFQLRVVSDIVVDRCWLWLGQSMRRD